MPFGGVGASGYGRFGGRQGIDSFTETLDHGGNPARAFPDLMGKGLIAAGLVLAASPAWAQAPAAPAPTLDYAFTARITLAAPVEQGEVAGGANALSRSPAGRSMAPC
jgi:hypothetical protein